MSGQGHYITIFGRPVRSWMVTAALAASSVGYAGLVFLPQQRVIGELRAEANEKEQHILQAERLTTPIHQAELRLASTRKFSDQWLKTAPRATDLTRVFALLADEAKLAGITVTRFDPQPAVELQTISEYSVALQLQGNFAQIYDLISRLEDLPYTIWIKHMHLTASSEDSENLQIELTLTILADRTDKAN